MLKKFQIFKESAPARPKMPEFWNFLEITVFREFWGWKFWNFLSITVFCEVKATKHCNAQIS